MYAKKIKNLETLSNQPKRIVVEMVGGSDLLGKREEGKPILPFFPILSFSPIWPLANMASRACGARASRACGARARRMRVSRARVSGARGKGKQSKFGTRARGTKASKCEGE